MNEGIAKFAAVLTGIIVLAIIAVLVKNGSQTNNIVQSFFSGFASLISAAANPGTSTASPLTSSTAVNSVANAFTGGGLLDSGTLD